MLVVVTVSEGGMRRGGTYGQPDGDVRVGRGAGAASVLLLAEGLDHDGVGDGSYFPLAFPFPFPHLEYVSKIVCAGRIPSLTGTAGIQRPHVEDINPLHFPQNLNTLETSRLLEIGGDGTGLGTLGEEIILILDLCISISTYPSSKKIVGVLAAP